MNILAISGSARDKNTNYMLRKVLDSISNKHQKDLILLKDKAILPCRNCKSCHQTFKCIIDDDIRDLHSKLRDADFILLGSPTYFDNVSGAMKNFMDRCLPFYFSKELSGKKVGLLSVGGFKKLVKYDENGRCIWCENGGECTQSVSRCIDAMSNFCNLLDMEVVGKVIAIHGNPKNIDTELIKLGKLLG